MSRLYDRIMRSKFGESEQAKTMFNIPIITVDNVAELYFSQKCGTNNCECGCWKTDWDVNDFPCVMPPFPNYFMEFRVPNASPDFHNWNSVGVYIDIHNIDEDKEIITVGFHSFHERNDRSIVSMFYLWEITLDNLGAIICKPDGSFAAIHFSNKTADAIARNKKHEHHDRVIALSHKDTRSFLMPFLLAISFMHCKNATVQLVGPPPKLSKKHQRRYGKPLVRYHVLDIEPMKKTLRTEGQVETYGLKHALHICRGHFKDYREGGGLFGKHKGLYWWESHVRGSAEEGVVDKDYCIKLKGGETS